MTAPITQPLKWPQVEYREIPNHPGYRAGTDGSIWSAWRFQGAGYAGRCRQVIGSTWRRILGSPRKEDGRLRYTLRRADGTYRRAYGSHFILEAFVGPRPKWAECCHDDGNCLNDSIGNLRWDTKLANAMDKIRHGTQVAGENHPKTKLSDADIEVVLALRRQGQNLSYIASRFRVSVQRIHQICKKGKR